MTQADLDRTEIIGMAIQAVGNYENKHYWPFFTEELEHFAKLVAEREREACAKVAQKTVCDTHISTGVRIYGTAAAKAIRARGEPTSRGEAT